MIVEHVGFLCKMEGNEDVGIFIYDLDAPDGLLNPEIVEYLGARGYDFKEKGLVIF